MKSAWKIVEGPMPKNHITTKAVVPLFKTDADGRIVKDGEKTRLVTVALLGLHVVGTIEGHPEFVWSTFEHVSHERTPWARDVAPAARANPGDANAAVVDDRVRDYALQFRWARRRRGRAGQARKRGECDLRPAA